MSPEMRVRATKAYCSYIAKSGRPILLGPFRSEVGFETLYWIPFLRWFKSTYNVKAERLFPVTRGGAGVLYPHMASADLYQLRSVDTVRKENAYDRQSTKMQKQFRCTEWDRDVLKEAAAQLLGRGAKYHVLHPSWMYWALEPWWSERRGLSHLNALTEFQPLVKPTYGALTLPGQFIACKWYARSTFPLNDAIKRHVSEITGTLAAQVPVVLLSSNHGGDEHTDLLVEGPNITALPQVPAHESVHLQAAVMARASAFVGTYGGVAQMALRMGIPSCSFYHAWGGTALAHKTLSDWLGMRTNTNFQVGNLSDTAMWRKVVSAPAEIAAPKAGA